MKTNSNTPVSDLPESGQNADFSIRETLLDVHRFEVVSDAAYAPLDGLAPGSAEAQARQKETAERFNLPLEIKTKVVGIRFRLIPSGKFLMGSPKSEIRRNDDERLHRVAITQPFYMGVFPVTQAQWERVTGTNPSHFQTTDDSLPVESVSWKQCVEFCAEMCKVENLPQETFDLPTEAQWEYACRAGTQTPYHFGDCLTDAHANIGRIITVEMQSILRRWFMQSKRSWPEAHLVPASGTCRVGAYQANAYGLFDLHGNVWEWCKDWYAEYTNRVNDPAGAGSGSDRVLRGGSWDRRARECRSAVRYKDAPGFTDSDVGFRLVLPAGQ